MVGGVGGDMLLDSDLGNMVDLVVDLNSNLVDNRGSVNSNWGSVSNSNRCGSSNSNRGSMSNGKGSSGGNRCNFSRFGGIDTLYQTMSQESMSQESMSKKTMSKDTSSNDLSISISSRSSKAT